MSPPLSCRNLQVVAHTFAVTKLAASHLRSSRSYVMRHLRRSNRRDKLFPAVTSKSFQNCHRMTIGANFELLCFRSLKLIAAKSSAKLLEPQWTLTKLKVRVNGPTRSSSRTCMRPRVQPKFDRMDAEAWPGTPKEVALEELIHLKVWARRAIRREVRVGVEKLEVGSWKLEVEVQVPVPPAAALPASPLSLPCPL